jgi:hypothetical protein
MFVSKMICALRPAWRNVGGAAVGLTVMLLGTVTEPASAAPGTKPEKQVSVLKSAAATLVPTPAASPLIAVVSIIDQRVTIWSGDVTVARAPVSTGMAGHRTPTGVFSVIGKERYHESNLYSNAPMPFMQRITWSGIAMHAGALPGYPASHGCIRLSDDFAQRFFGMTRMGMRVIIADHDLSPASFTHDALPAPTFVRADQMLASDVLPAGRMLLGASPELRAAAGKLLNPIERGRLELGRAKVLAHEAQADARALLEIATIRAVEARSAADNTRAAEAAVQSIKGGRDRALEALVSPALRDGDKPRLNAQKEALDTAYFAALARVAAARQALHDTDAAAFHAAGEAKAAVAERDAAEHAARVAERATEPVSIFVSRKERRVFVRQGFEPVFEADVEILEPQVPLGTHVFTAVAPPAEGGAMKWVALTVPGQVSGQARSDAPVTPSTPSAGRSSSSVRTTEVRAVSLSGNAGKALDRVKLSDEVLQKISEKLWIGASVIISDHGMSTETGKGTDFVVLTK